MNIHPSNYRRWLHHCAVTNQRAVTVAKAFVDEVVGSNLCGVPSKLLTDQGRNFEADLIRQVFTALRNDVPYHPQTDG